MQLEQAAQWPGVISAFASVVLAGTAIVALVAAIGNWKAAQQASKAAEAANEQARLDSIAQTRPYVSVELALTIAGDYGWDMIIRNAGQSAARELTLDFDSWPEDPDQVTKDLQLMFETPRTLPPGSSLRTIWRPTTTGSFEDGRSTAGVDGAGVVVAKYTSDDPSAPEYEDVYEIDTERMGNRPVGTWGPELKRGRQPTPRQFYRLGQRALSRLSEISGK